MGLSKENTHMQKAVLIHGKVVKATRIAAIVMVFLLPASAQIGLPLQDCETLLGRPITIHQSSPPSRLYIHDGLHVQVSYKEGIAIGVLYRIPTPNGNAEIPQEKMLSIYKLNDKTPLDFVEIGTRFTELKGIYSISKDGEVVALKNQNIFAIHIRESLPDELKRMIEVLSEK